jgi:hypothetical protein
MRVCLDTALGAPWPTVVNRPAVRHLTDKQLLAAISVAQSLLKTPAILHELNQQSIQWRMTLLKQSAINRESLLR